MTEKWKTVELKELPGHYARRIHQLAVALYMQEVGANTLTPVQYSALQTISANPGIDQKTLAIKIGCDTSTVAGVLDRLEVRGLALRTVSHHDRRVRLITPTAKGLETLETSTVKVLASQARFLEPLSKAERTEFVRMMKVLVAANAELANTPAKE